MSGKLEGVLVAIATRDGSMSSEVRNIFNRAETRVHVTGCSDVALARNIQLSRAWEQRGDCSYILLLDDDMQIDEESLWALLNHVLESVQPAFLVYVDGKGRPCCMSAEDALGRYFLAGLGAMCLPIGALEELQDRSDLVDAGPNGKFWAFTSSDVAFSSSVKRNGKVLNVGPLTGRWLSEDYQLCLRLHHCGFTLTPVGTAGHFKRVALYPHQDTIKSLTEGEPEPLHFEPTLGE